MKKSLMLSWLGAGRQVPQQLTIWQKQAGKCCFWIGQDASSLAAARYHRA
jgi:hypothetical protein